ncbi:MAG: FkbM family methyltransferase [Bacteroidia bacterium]
MSLFSIDRVKQKFKCFTNGDYRKSFDLCNLSNRGSIYNFDVVDAQLYLLEKKAKLNSAIIGDSFEDLSLIQIENRKIFWKTSIPSDDLPWLYHEIFDPFLENPSSYDHPKMKYEEASWIIDAGCCEGYFSLFAFEKNCKCKVIAFEPMQEMQVALNNTFKKEKLKSRFFLIDKALGDANQTLEFQVDGNHICDSGVVLNGNTKGSTSYLVESIKLDTVMHNYSLLSNGIIKMDIEGEEMNALIGAEELLTKFKPRLAIAVYHNYENAIKCRDIILKFNPDYQVEFRGLYEYFSPPRPYLLFAW